MAKTNAQLKAELDALREENARLAAAASRGPRERFPTGLWPNTRRRTERDPAWTGSVRAVIPENAQPGDAFWLDISVWEFDPETSPARYESNPPDFSLSLSPSTPEWAREQEHRREKALRERGLV